MTNNFILEGRKKFAVVVAPLLQDKRTRTIILFLALYTFLLSINTMGAGFKNLKDESEYFTNFIDDPISSFCVGLLITGLIQSSSGTTSILVALCAEGVIPVDLTIPAIMGANIGTAITNTVVSFGHLGRKNEFKLAFGGSLVHDYFNILAVLILLPLELVFHPLEYTATGMAYLFKDIGGIKFSSPIKTATKPIVHFFEGLVAASHYQTAFLVLLGVFILFMSLKIIVSCTRLFVNEYGEALVEKYLFKGPKGSFALGLGLTATVQSSSITTSLIIPLIASGVLKIRKILPYTIGANIGTTVTTILAALAASAATGTTAPLILAFVHLLFNVFGGAIIYGIKPLRNVPIVLAERSGQWAVDSRKGFIVLVGGYVIGTSYVFPILYLLLRRMF